MWKKIIDKDLIVIEPKVKNKKELFEGMVNHVYEHDHLRNRKQFLKALFDREDVSNTELIPEIALPHARSESVVDLFVSIIIIKDGIDYENPQMGDAKIIFFFGCDEIHHKEYLRLLAKSNRILKNEEFRDKLIKCKKPGEVIDLLDEYDDEYEKEEEDSNQLMIFTLNDPSSITEVMNAMVEVGITNASVVEASSMARKLAYELPIFAGLSYMARGKSQQSNLILAHLENKNVVKNLVNILKDQGIDLNKKGVGFIQTIKVENIYGDFEEDIEL